ncbi:MAG: alpha/beta fold hydrolase, partial [Candidatus Dormibacteria bacterium]
MSQLEGEHNSLRYLVDGPEGAPPLVLLNSLGTTTELWAGQMAAFSRFFRVVRYDHPGHGGSGPAAGGISIDTLGAELLRLLDHLGIGRASFCGLSLGAMVALTVAARHPERVERLVAASTVARMPQAGYWRGRAARVREEGLEPLAAQLLERWFSAGYLQSQPPLLADLRHRLLGVDRSSYAAACEALETFDLTPELALIQAPTLVLAGAGDLATPAELALALQQGIPGAELLVLARAGHLANVERPQEFSEAALRHLVGGPRERGLRVRRRVLGDAHVDRALARATLLDQDFQELITAYAWGEVWSRPGLDLPTRRLLTIALLTALGRFDELEMHLRAARHDLTEEQVREVLL